MLLYFFKKRVYQPWAPLARALVIELVSKCTLVTCPSKQHDFAENHRISKCNPFNPNLSLKQNDHPAHSSWNYYTSSLLTLLENPQPQLTD